jgi:hypothetical protein
MTLLNIMMVYVGVFTIANITLASHFFSFN